MSSASPLKLLFKDIQASITVMYLLMVGIGMLFTYQKYQLYGINIFEYADVFDFLIAPFQDVYIFLWTLGTVIITWLFGRFDSYLKNAFPKFHTLFNFGLNKKFNTILYTRVQWISILIVYLVISAKIYGIIAEKENRKKAPVQITFVDNTKENGILIGKTKDVLFLLKGEHISIIPFNSLVKSINPEKQK